MAGDPFAVFARGGKISFGKFNELCDVIEQAEQLGKPSTSSGGDHKLAPRSIDEYIGQDRLKARISVHVASARARHEPCESFLLLGPPGAGKTTLAEIIATMLDQPLVTLKKPVEAWQLRMQLAPIRDGGLLFLDEVHQWPKKGQHVLMQLLEDRTLDWTLGPQSFPGLSVVAATTDPQALVGPLVSRFAAVEQMEPYSIDDMRQIIRGMAKRSSPQVKLSDGVATALARAAAGVPRQARQLVTSARDLKLAGATLNAEVVLGFCGIDPDGLSQAHNRYLTVLTACNGQAGLSTLAGRLGMPEQQVRDLEWLLLDRNYIAFGPSGRMITPGGQLRASAAA